ncbi:MAG TPA: neutral zinc metallopeptidase [Actinopolymorphaceae bacterium]
MLVRLVRVIGFLAILSIVASLTAPVLRGVLGGGGLDDVGSGSTRDPGSERSGDDRPGPARPGSATAVLQDNRFYTVGAFGPVDCPAPDLVDASAASQRAYDERVFGCLVEGWRPLIERAGGRTSAPDLYVFDSSGTSPCGSFSPSTGRILAFYCPTNQTMYADVRQMARAFPPRHHIVYALVLAHEYGHHVQNVTGILSAESRLAYQEPALETELSRRTETQASCLAGMFVRGIEKSYPIEGVQREALEFYAYRAFGDPEGTDDRERSHGSSTSQGRWIERGFAENDTAACNTFVADAQDVE